jgi:hypothetical protein
VAVTNIHSVSVSLGRVYSGTNGFVWVHFVHHKIAASEDLIRDAVRSKRMVQITDGNRIIAQARLVAQFHDMMAGGAFVLEFESVKSAAEATSRFRELGTLDPPKLDTDDQSRWILQAKTVQPNKIAAGNRHRGCQLDDL